MVFFLFLVSLLSLAEYGVAPLPPSSAPENLPGARFVGGQMRTSSGFLGNTEMKMASPRFDFDEDLYVSEDIFCSSKNFVPNVATCVPCNYSGAILPDGRCADEDLNARNLPQIEGLNLPDCPCDSRLCEGETLFADAPPLRRKITKSEEIRMIFRYTHTDWEHGFAIRVVPVAEGPFDVILSTDVSLNASKMLSYSYATDPFEVLLACPSFPIFGAAAQTITYFVMILAKDSDIGVFDVSVESVPSLAPDEENVGVVPNLTIGSNSGPNEIGKTPIIVPGTLMVDTFGFQPRFFIMWHRYPIDTCRLLSVHVEILNQNITEFNYFSMVIMSIGYSWEERVAEIAAPKPQPFSFTPLIEVAYNVSFSFVAGSAGTVVSVCPQVPNQQNYFQMSTTGGYWWRDWEILIHIRDATTSPYLKKRKIGELNPLQFQRRLNPFLILKTPCFDCDECDSPDRSPGSARFFNRRNFFRDSDYTALVNNYTPPCDLSRRFSYTFDQKTSISRCDDLWRDSACGLQRVIPVFPTGNPRIYPMPDVARLENAFSFRYNVDSLDFQPILNKSISMLITLATSETVFINPEKLAGSSIFFTNPSVFHTKDYGPPPLEPLLFSSLDATPFPCSQSSFQTVSSQMNALEELLDSIVQDGVIGLELEPGEAKDDVTYSLDLSSSAAYGGFALMFTDEWESCENLTNSFVDFEAIARTITDTSECIEFDGSDPCCNVTLEWEECCVAEGRVVEVLSNSPIRTNESSVQDSCSSPFCMSTFVDDYRRTFDQVYVEGTCESSTDDFLPDTEALMQECKTEWIGDDASGMICDTHEDCIDIYGGPHAENPRCDLSVRRCVGVRKAMEIGFLECLVTKMDSVTRSAIFTQIQRLTENATAPTTEILYNLLLENETCVSDYGPMHPRRSHFHASSLNDMSRQLCLSCYDTWCLTRIGCTTPLQCLDLREVCDPTVVYFNPKTCFYPTENDYFCNWDNSILSAVECQNDEFKCMYCYNSFHCVSLPANSQSECENTPLCLRQDGQILWDVSESECNDVEYCTEKCNGQECATSEDCENISGYCEDTDEILKSVQHAATNFDTLAPSLEGVCVVPIKPFNQPPCPFVTEFEVADFTLDTIGGESYDFTTHRGCVVFSNCTPGIVHFASGTGGGGYLASCRRTAIDPADCQESYGGRWLPLPIQTQEDCENPLGLPADQSPGFCKEINNHHLSQKSREECLACEGTPQAPSTWRKGRIVRGISEKGEWKKTEMVSSYHFVNDSISFFDLNLLFEVAVQNVQAFREQVTYSCSISPFVNTYDLFSCDCGTENQSYIDCPTPYLDAYEDNAKISVGGVWFCPGDINYEVGFLSGRILVNGEWINGSVCQFADIEFAPSEVFVGNHKRLPLTIFGDPNEVDPLPVRNARGASVGQILGDGFSLRPLQAPGSDVSVSQVEIVLFLDRSKIEDLPASYVFDFGIEVLDPRDRYHKNELELRPLSAMNLSLTMTLGEFLEQLQSRSDAELSGMWANPFSYGTGARIYPIGRIENYLSVKTSDVLTDGEQAMMIVFAVLYGLAFCVVVFAVIRAPTSFTNLLLFSFVLLTFLFRCIYVSMFAAGYFREEDAGSFVLVEPPSFFILSITSVIVLSFSFCLYCVKHSVQQESVFGKFWFIWFLFTLFLYCVLAIVLALLSTLDTSDDVVRDCFGREVEVKENFTVETIRIAYHSFLFVLAVVAAVAVNYLGYELTSTVQIDSLSQLSNISGISVMMTSTLWVIYSALSGSTPYFVIPLWFCECLPLLVLCALVVPSEKQAAQVSGEYYSNSNRSR